jgi:polysaccharide export outer membrane protein
VVVREPASQRFYILGEVARTGEYPLLKELTILQAFAMAGGFTEWATKKEIILIRKKRQGGNDIVKIDYKKLVQGKGLEQNVILRADDTIIVP